MIRFLNSKKSNTIFFYKRLFPVGEIILTLGFGFVAISAIVFVYSSIISFSIFEGLRDAGKVLKFGIILFFIGGFIVALKN